MKKIIQAAVLILIAACAILAAASSYPAPAVKNGLQRSAAAGGDPEEVSGCRHTPDAFIYQPNH